MYYALTREYPLQDPPAPIKGQFGDRSLPNLRFVVLGDSTTTGVGTTPEKSFPWLLASWLGQKFHVTLEVVGVGGATTRDVAETQVDRALALRPDLMLLEVGANDTTHAVKLGRVQRNVASALDRMQASGAKIVVAAPPHMGTSPVMPQPLRTISGWRGTAVAKRIEAEARERGIAYIDLAAGTREAFEEHPERYYSTDWFHPGTGGYQLWAEVMFPTVLEVAEGR